jgi:ATP-binding cassette subfamily B protein
MVAKYHGRHYSLQSLREKAFMNREGISLLEISRIAEAIGLRSMGVKIDFDLLANEAPLPAVVHWNQNHFVVVHQIKGSNIYVADPGQGLIKYTKEEFYRGWCSDKEEGQKKGVVLLLEPQPDFFVHKDEEEVRKDRFSFLFKYLFQYKKYVFQLVLGLLLGSLLQLVVPFLTQAVVDFGIGTRNLHFVYLMLIAQLVLFASQTAVGFIRAWILIHISTRINISIISDFLIKLMKLPIGFFDSKMVGDLIQRIQDHRRIESFLTGSVLNSLFSFFSLIVFSCVLIFYSLPIFLIFITGSTLYVGWILIFLKRRAQLDHKSFAQMAANQSSLIQLIYGMQEIKLNNIEREKRWEWEGIQAKLFRISLQKLALSQYQQGGGQFFTQMQNIFITFLAAKLVIDGEMTLGMMMAITYIIGQLNGPISQLIGFIQQAQDAKISLERLGEIHGKKDEEGASEHLINQLPIDKTLSLSGLSFRYGGEESPVVLDDVQLEIPAGKVTAIVGMSGSGKTTLLKLLLKFYSPQYGQIKLGGFPLPQIQNHLWRDACGTVMQDGFVFSDTIAANIALKKPIDKLRLYQAVQVANIQDFIESLPLGYNTKIGQEGVGLSAGQKQRLLIARAVYKNPEFLFFDEATNALDANNEKIIMENLEAFFEQKTVVVVAHRLSTVKDADQIIVLDKGKIIERGSHETLTARQGAYYQLVKNQLELGQ